MTDEEIYLLSPLLIDRENLGQPAKNWRTDALAVIRGFQNPSRNITIEKIYQPQWQGYSLHYKILRSNHIIGYLEITTKPKVILVNVGNQNSATIAKKTFRPTGKKIYGKRIDSPRYKHRRRPKWRKFSKYALSKLIKLDNPKTISHIMDS